MDRHPQARPEAIPAEASSINAIVIGTAGWSIPKAVAPAFPAEGSALARYAGRFRGVEINSTFYRSHRAPTYARWRDSVPPTFRFAVKIPKTISHEKQLEDVAGDFAAFLHETSELGDRRGPLLLQLPPKFAFDKGIAAAFFSLSRALFQGPLVIEPRHPSWFATEAEALLTDHQIARAGADPPRAEGGVRPGGFRGLTYLRLHGAPRTYFSAYDAAALNSVATILLTSPGPRWCIFDNTASGAAAADALRLQDVLAL